jgi:protein SCO1
MLRVGVLKSVALAMAGLLLCACNPSPPTSDVELPSGFELLGRGVDDVVLRGADGTQVRWGDLNGAPRALFFGFTHCPDICPTTVQALGAAKARLGRQSDAIKIDFVTVDPERDTPEALTTYFDSLGVGVRITR